MIRFSFSFSPLLLSPLALSASDPYESVLGGCDCYYGETDFWKGEKARRRRRGGREEDLGDAPNCGKARRGIQDMGGRRRREEEDIEGRLLR